jgi:hypothetical protein
MLDNGFGVDVVNAAPLGTMYNKNGLWRVQVVRNKALRTSCRKTWSWWCSPTPPSVGQANSSATL